MSGYVTIGGKNISARQFTESGVDKALSRTLIALDEDQDVDTTHPLPVAEGSISKGYQQVTSTGASATLASLCAGAALPAGAKKVLLTPTAPVRVRDDGNPSAAVGYPIAAGIEWNYDGDQLASLKVYGAATIDCWFYA